MSLLTESYISLTQVNKADVDRMMILPCFLHQSWSVHDRCLCLTQQSFIAGLHVVDK